MITKEMVENELNEKGQIEVNEFLKRNNLTNLWDRIKLIEILISLGAVFPKNVKETIVKKRGDIKWQKHIWK